MMRNYRLLPSVSAERWRLETWVSGLALLGDPLLNRGTAFTPEEREELDLVGLLPSAVTTIDEQVKRSYAQYQQQPDDLSKNIYLSALQDRNEVLFYRLLSEHFAEMLPVVVAVEVAKTAVAEGLARVPLTDVGKLVQDTMWQPVYPQLQVSQEARV